MGYFIQPKGWFREFLLKQKNGLTGHIQKAGYPFDEVEWGDNKILTKLGPAWWVYEQTGYWLDGYTRCACLLEDEEMLKNAKRIIYNVIDNADKDGYLGPDFLKECKADGEGHERWAHVVFFRACIALYEYTEDCKIVEALEKHYLGYVVDYSCGRNVLNVEIMLWVYGKTQNSTLLNLAVESYKRYNGREQPPYCVEAMDKVALSDKKPYCHGVTYNEYSKLGAILYKYTKNLEYLQASVNAYKKIDKYFMLIDGLHACDEEMWGNNIMESHEACDITDFTWSQYYVYEVTHNTDYLEKVEKCVFNAGLGQMDEEFKALQYLSSVNQVLCTENSESSPHGYRGTTAGQYAPNPSTACCPGNVNRFMPNYVWNMWAREQDGIYLRLYGASKVEYEECSITETTEFPYGNKVSLDVACKKPFDLFIRLPKWADSVIIDGQSVVTKKGGYHKLAISQNKQMEIEFTVTPKVNVKKNYAYVTKGLLLYAFPVPSDVQKSADEEFPTYSIIPNGIWNYGLKKDTKTVEKDGDLYIEGYIVKNWVLKKNKSFKKLGRKDGQPTVVKGDFIFTPTIPTKVETDGIGYKIRLIPYGKTMARVAAFPIIK